MEKTKHSKPILDDKAKQAIEKAYQSILEKGDDAKISSGPNGTVKVYEIHTKLVLDTAKI